MQESRKESVKNFDKVVVGLVINDIAEKNALTFCSFGKPVSVLNGKPFFMCGLGHGVCFSDGKCLKFKHLYDGFHIIWVCERRSMRA